MATGKKKNNKSASHSKRVHRTKVAKEAKENKGGKTETSLQRVERRERNRKIGIAVAAIVFAVIMVLSMMLPSIASVFRQNQAQNQAETTTEDSSTESATTKTGLEGVNDQYRPLVEADEAKLKDDPNNLSALLDAGNQEMNWGYRSSMYATSDEDKNASNEHFNKSIAYFDRYLAINDSKAVHVDRSLCQFYSGATDEAIAYLEDYANKNSDYAPAWANLGMMYESKMDTAKAKEYYNKAMEVDPDDKYGTKEYTQQRLDSINSTEQTENITKNEGYTGDFNSDVSNDATKDTNKTNTSIKGLSDTLNSKLEQ